MTELRIRVDVGTKAKIEENAKKKGISMNEYVGAIIEDYMRLPEHRALEDRYINLMNEFVSSYQNLTKELGEVIAENTELLGSVAASMRRKEEASW